MQYIFEMFFRSIYIQSKFGCFLRAVSSNSKYLPEVVISQGKLRGSQIKDLDGKPYYRFQGIPYARPPIRNLRFKAPIALDSWSGILDATKEASGCYSRHPLQRDKTQGSEDCLYLNVYTKNLDDKSLKPVMFWIHGGGFIFGSGGTEFYGPDFLITEDVIVVTINHRLGILGFLSLEDPSLEVPGNAGLKDIVMALTWVKDNIAKFGGDPKNVTIFGHSSGGVAVHLLMFSPMGRGLFHKAISMSGCALTLATRGVKGVARISPLIDHIHNGSDKEILEKLMKMPVEDLYKIQNKLDDFQSHVPSLQRPFGYVVENPNQEAFLTEEPANLMLRGDFQQIPYITGYTTAENLLYVTRVRRRRWPGFETCEDVIPFNFGYKIGSSESVAVARDLRKFYFGNYQVKFGDEERLLMESDLNFVYGIYLSLMMQLPKAHAPMFLYRMSINSGLNLLKNMSKIKHPGFAHGDDLNYLFKNFATPKIIPGSKEEIAVRRLVRLWSNFAKFGNPTPSREDPLLPIAWKPVTNEEVVYLEFGDSLTVSSNSEELRRVKFLKSLFRDNPSRLAYPL